MKKTYLKPRTSIHRINTVSQMLANSLGIYKNQSVTEGWAKEENNMDWEEN